MELSDVLVEWLVGNLTAGAIMASRNYDRAKACYTELQTSSIPEPNHLNFLGYQLKRSLLRTVLVSPIISETKIDEIIGKNPLEKYVRAYNLATRREN
ncbi:MAG TPA: hypothetical protein VJI68_00360 [Candidatus Nanoarchaeia archaeon]|nr:hypothetical protein [Candidatus Nanoarchaeia archaeon]